MSVFCDNMAALPCTAMNGGNKLRYMVERKYHYVKECCRKLYVRLLWVESKKQLADIFTKALEKSQSNKLSYKILNMM